MVGAGVLYFILKLAFTKVKKKSPYDAIIFTKLVATAPTAWGNGACSW